MSIVSLDCHELIAVRGTWKKLELSVGQRYVLLTPGDIIRGILEIDDSSLEAVFDFAESLQNDCEGLRRCFSERNSVEYGTLSRTLYKKIHELFPTPLGQIFILLPAQGSFLNAARYINQQCYADSEWGDDYRLISLPGKMGEWRKSNDEYNSETWCWLSWIYSLITGTPDEVYWSDVKRYGNPLKIFDVIMEYSRNLRALCVEITKLRRDLPGLIGIVDLDGPTKKSIESDVFSWTARGQALWPEEERELFGSVTVKGEPAVAVTAMSTLIRYELQLCNQHGMTFKRCEYCEGVFATHNSKKKYCNYPNIKYGGRRCKEIAAQRVHTEKVENSPLRKEKEDNKNKYGQWVRRVTTEKEIEKNAHMRWLRENIIFRFGEDVWHLLMKKIKEEVDTIYAEWRENAERKVKDFEAGSISEKDYMDALKAPSVKARSTILAYIKEMDFYIDEDDLEDLGIIKKK